jgi:asparagine synthase (glutamine-hydrolysing)
MSADTWIVVLPDSDSGDAVAAPLLASVHRLIRHASGRPWLLGCWPDDEVLLAEAGTARIALIGRCAGGTTALAAGLATIRRAADADALASRLSGCFHLVVSVAGQVRVQGSVAQTRRVFYARLGNATVAADRADVLARHVRADVDEAVLAARMMFPIAPPPLAGRALWQGVHAVPGDSYLRLDPDGAAEVVRWWRPPAPDRPLVEAVDAVREALQAAVRARTETCGAVSADLSGGLDSTSLCFLAAGHAVPLVTFRQESVDPGNDDARWAQHAAAALPQCRHLVTGHDGLPGKYAKLGGPGTDLEEPFNWVRSRADLAAIASRMAETGARLHLGGHGGDELFTVPPSYLHTLVRAHPWEAIRHLRGRQAIRRWSTAAMVRSLAERDDYPGWFARQASELFGPALDPIMPCLSWGPPCRMPPWASAHALELVGTLIRQNSTDLAPLAPIRAHHQILEHAAICGRTIRQADRLFAAAGTRLEAPYLDDRVIEAALAARLHDRGTPRCYKPLLAAAMAGTVPAPILHRRTKGEFSADTYVGLRRHRAELLCLTEDSLLAERGLLDANALRRAIMTSYAKPEPLWLVDMTIATEMWLRAQPAMFRRPPELDHRITEKSACA